MKISIIIPARDEEAFIGRCLDSIKMSASRISHEVEIITVINRCTDKTEQIACAAGARIVYEDAHNLACIRNRGAAAATGDVVVTIDADSWMTENMLPEICRALETGKYIGGGVRVLPERWSLGIMASTLLLYTSLFFTGLAGGLYWCRKEDFDAVGGFNEGLKVAEDLDFAARLKKHGKKKGLKLKTIHKASITTSCRKFDRFGDWLVFKLIFFPRRKVKAVLTGEDDAFARKYFYDFEH